MKAYVLSGPGAGLGAWSPAERPDPVAGPGQVLVGVKAVSLNYRDWAMAEGSYPAPVAAGRVPVSDGAGVVLATGPDVHGFAVGDRVVASFLQPTGDLGGGIDGMLVERIVLPASGLLHFPDYLSFEEAATLPCAGVTAWNALMEQPVPLPLGATVLTLGSGGVSVFALQLAKAAGLRVIGTSGSDAKLEHLAALGLDHGINYRSVADWPGEVRRLTAGRGADQVIEVAGDLATTLKAVAFGGTVSLIGFLSHVAVPVSAGTLLFSGAKLQPIMVGSIASFGRLNRALEQTRIRPVIDREFPFDQAPDALALLAKGGHFGKIVIRVGD